MEELIQQMRSGSLEAPRIEQLMELLAQKLKHTSGKKQYGYLRAPLKAVVDEIVDELSKDSRVAGAYDQWYFQRKEVLRTYKDDLPPRLPLSQQKEFKRIKNLVIQEAVRLGEYTEVFSPEDTVEQETTEADIEPDAAPVPEDGPHDVDTPESDDKPPPAVKWNDRCAPQAKYRVAKRILSDSNARPEQVANAVIWLTQAAEAGLGYAQYALGKLYRDGGPVEQDPIKAVVWFAQAAEQDNQYDMYALALFAFGREERQIGRSLTAAELTDQLQSHILPHQNRGSINNRNSEIAAQMQSVLAKCAAPGIRSAEDKEQLAQAWLNLAVSLAKVPVKYDAEILKQ